MPKKSYLFSELPENVQRFIFDIFGCENRSGVRTETFEQFKADCDTWGHCFNEHGQEVEGPGSSEGLLIVDFEGEPSPKFTEDAEVVKAYRKKLRDHFFER